MLGICFERLCTSLSLLSLLLTPWRLGGFGDVHKKNQQFSVALPTP